MTLNRDGAPDPDSSITMSGPVLLATPLTNASEAAARKADAISAATDADLVLLRISSPESSHPLDLVADDGPPLRRFALNPGTSERRRGRRHMTRRGDFLSVVAETARSLSPALVIIPEICGQTAPNVYDLVLECRAPVLLAREGGGADSIVAATNLEVPTFPVLRAGALLSWSLGARVVFVHNLTLDTSLQPRTPAMLKQPLASILDRLDDLSFIASSLRVDSDNIVTIRPSSSEALLSVVDRERADVVVVGARRRTMSPLHRVPLAEEVIDAVSTSVLVVPLDASNYGRERISYGVS